MLRFDRQTDTLFLAGRTAAGNPFSLEGRFARSSEGRFIRVQGRQRDADPWIRNFFGIDEWLQEMCGAKGDNEGDRVDYFRAGNDRMLTRWDPSGLFKDATVQNWKGGLFGLSPVIARDGRRYHYDPGKRLYPRWAGIVRGPNQRPIVFEQVHDLGLNVIRYEIAHPYLVARLEVLGVSEVEIIFRLVEEDGDSMQVRVDLMGEDVILEPEGGRGRGGPGFAPVGPSPSIVPGDPNTPFRTEGLRTVWEGLTPGEKAQFGNLPEGSGDTPLYEALLVERVGSEAVHGGVLLERGAAERAALGSRRMVFER